MKKLPMALAGMMMLSLSTAPALTFADEMISGSDMKQTDTLKKDAETGLTMTPEDKDKNLGKSDINKDVVAPDRGDIGKPGTMSGDQDTLKQDKSFGGEDKKLLKDTDK